MKIPIYQIDAFTGELFHGNPAAVCPLERWLPDEVMQAIAAENNLAETAFYIPKGPGRFGLRWFTPGLEIPLCGHATVATAAVVREIRKESGSEMVFESLSGDLPVAFEDGLYHLNFPGETPRPCAPPAGLFEGLGARPTEILGGRYHIAVFDTQEAVATLAPDFLALAKVDHFAVGVTAPGQDCDFVSRFFAPRAGITEDPVTGSLHTLLIPYWSKRLGKTKLFARQISARGGELHCEDRGERVRIGGRAVRYLEGSIDIA